ncbi:MAG: ankyrin repeat domain-containing protein [Proteobacteria bacterium]|nr:ankyrin repeat domain-containing protein [Pseudomonadota bacterium]
MKSSNIKKLLKEIDNADLSVWNYSNHTIIENFTEESTVSNTSSCRYIPGNGQFVHSLVELSNGNLASGGWDGNVKIWNTETGAFLKALNHCAGGGQAVYSLVKLSNGNLASGGWDGNIKIWNTETGTCLKTLNHCAGNGQAVQSLVELSNGNLASGGWDGNIKIWNTETGTCLKTLSHGAGNGQLVHSLVELSNGDLASGGWDGNIKIWNTETGVCLKALNHCAGGGQAVYSLVVLWSGNLVSGGYDGNVKIWNTGTGACLKKLNQGGNGCTVTSLVQFSNGCLASGGYSGDIQIWNINENMKTDPSAIRSVSHSSGNGQFVYSLVELSNGNLASGGNDGNVKIWELGLKNRKININELNTILDALISKKGLKKLNLSNSTLNQQSIDRILSIIGLNCLESIDLRSTNLSDEWLKKLSDGVKLNNNTMLEFLTDKVIPNRLRVIMERNKAVSVNKSDVSEISIPEECVCPISHSIMIDPVLLMGDGYTYEREEIEYWLSANNISPMAHVDLTQEDKKVIPNVTQRRAIDAFLNKYPALRESEHIYVSKSLKNELISSVKVSDFNKVSRILEKDIRLMTMSLDDKKETLLSTICRCGGINILEPILERLGARIFCFLDEKMNLTDLKLFELASANPSLKEKGAKMIADKYLWDESRYQAALFAGIKSENLDMIRACFDTSEINLKAIEDGKTLLHCAAETTRTDIVDYLLEKGVPIGICDSEGSTPLHTAAKHANHVMIVHLLRCGADGKAKDNNHKTPADYARTAGKSHTAFFIDQQRQKIKTEPLMNMMFAMWSKIAPNEPLPDSVTKTSSSFSSDATLSDKVASLNMSVVEKDKDDNAEKITKIEEDEGKKPKFRKQ